MRKEKKNIKESKILWKLIAVYLFLLAIIAGFWIGVIWLVVNIIKWAWGA